MDELPEIMRSFYVNEQLMSEISFLSNPLQVSDWLLEAQNFEIGQPRKTFDRPPSFGCVVGDRGKSEAASVIFSDDSPPSYNEVVARGASHTDGNLSESDLEEASSNSVKFWRIYPHYDVIRRTIHVSDIDHQVTEELLAALFINCGQVVDCRIRGDPKSHLRFALIEFTDEEGARNALSLAGTMLGYYPVRVLPSKTAIAPINPNFFCQDLKMKGKCVQEPFIVLTSIRSLRRQT